MEKIKWTCKWISPNTGLDIRARVTYYELVWPQKQVHAHKCIHRLLSYGNVLIQLAIKLKYSPNAHETSSQCSPVVTSEHGSMRWLHVCV